MAFVALLLLLAVAAATSAAELGVLDLSLRGLTTLDAASLSSLNTTSLTVNLSGNAISSWGIRPFRILRNVTVLDLSGNQLHTVDADALADTSSVRELNLSDNAVESLAGRPFRALVKLVHLDLSNNKLRTLDGSSLGDLVALQRLSLRGNALVALEDADLRGLSRLQWLDVSNNAIHSAAAGALRGLNGLGELSAGDNPDVGSIVVVGRRLLRVSMPRAGLTAVPASLTRSVRTLILQGNHLTAIASGDLDSYPLLRELDLSSNRLDTIEDDALGRLEQLTVLRLSGNRLRYVPPGLPAALVTLQLDHNRIKYVSAGDFQGLLRLEELSLGGNRLHELPAGVFRYLRALETFDLSYNPLETLHADALEGLSRLRVLHMISLTELLSPASWLPFPVASERLNYLDVSGSPVLAAQLLSDTAALTAMRQLAELRIRDSALTTLRPDLPSLLTRTRRLQFSANPWNCSVPLLLWLPAWISSMEVDDARCAEPTRLRGRLLMTLSKTTESTDSSLKSNSSLSTTTASATRRYPSISTTPQSTATVHSSSAPTSPEPSSSAEQKSQAPDLPTTTSMRQNLTTSKSSASPSSTSRLTVSTTPTLLVSSPSTQTSTNTPTTSKDSVPETSQRKRNATSQEGTEASSPADKFNQEISSTQIPLDKKDPPDIHLIPPSTTQVRDKHLGRPQQEAINFSAWTSTTGMSSSANEGLSLTTAADEAPSISPRPRSPTTSSTTRLNPDDEPPPSADSQSADLSHKRIPLPSREALTAERAASGPPGSSTSSLLAMFGVGAVGSALVLLVLAAAHAAPRPRLDLLSYDNPGGDTREDDDDDSRTELW